MASTSRSVAAHGHDHAAAWWWQYARVTAHRLKEGLPLATWPVYGTILDRGETAYVCGDALYRRYRRGHGVYEPFPLIVFGSPAFVVGSMIGNAIGNARARRAARRASALAWRDHQHCGVVATSRGIHCLTGSSTSTMIYHSSIAEFHPDPWRWTLTLGFGGTDNPVLLTGLAVPTVTLIVAHHLDIDPEYDPRLVSLVT